MCRNMLLVYVCARCGLRTRFVRPGCYDKATLTRNTIGFQCAAAQVQAISADRQQTRTPLERCHDRSKCANHRPGKLILHELCLPPCPERRGRQKKPARSSVFHVQQTAARDLRVQLMSRRERVKTDDVGTKARKQALDLDDDDARERSQ